MRNFDPVRRKALLQKLAELQPVTLKELTSAMNEDYTFVVRCMAVLHKGEARISGWETHCSKHTALWSAGAGLDAKKPKPKSRSKAYLRQYHREYYHRQRKQRLHPSPSFGCALAALMGERGLA